MDLGYQVAAVVNGDVGFECDYIIDVAVVFFRGFPFVRPHADPFIRQGGGHIILRGERVAPGNGHLSAAGDQRADQYPGFLGNVQGKADSNPF